MRAPYLHEAYRAVSVGLQAGVAAVALAWLLRIFGVCACTCACGTFWLATVLGTLVAGHVSHWRLPAAARGVLITGCDSGFGLALAQRLQALGCTVFAGCLQAQGDKQSDGARELRQLKNVHVLQIDVTDDQQIEAAREYVNQHLPLKGLWGVVNNAGVFLCGPAEWILPEEAARVYDVNTLGTLRISRAFLPLLRQTKGRLVNIASVAGRAYSGPMTCYGMTKHALEALSDALRLEQRRFGVHVAIVEPGNYAAATGILQTQAQRVALSKSWERLSDETRAAYGAGSVDEVARCFEQLKGVDPARPQDAMAPVLAAMEHALLGHWPAPRYTPADVGRGCGALRAWLNTHGPEWLFEAVFS